MSKNLEDIIELNNQHPEKTQFSLLWLTVVYCVALLSCWMSFLISPLFLPLGYVVGGVFLSAFISRHFRWWLMANTIEIIFRAKIKFIPRWIFATPRLLLKAFIAKFG